jgi:hypothetical protein
LFFFSGFPVFAPLAKTAALPSSLVTTAAESSAEPIETEIPAIKTAEMTMRAILHVNALI